jgi:hypothetical protein
MRIRGNTNNVSYSKQITFWNNKNLDTAKYIAPCKVEFTVLVDTANFKTDVFSSVCPILYLKFILLVICILL